MFRVIWKSFRHVFNDLKINFYVSKFTFKIVILNLFFVIKEIMFRCDRSFTNQIGFKKSNEKSSINNYLELLHKQSTFDLF